MRRRTDSSRLRRAFARRESFSVILTRPRDSRVRRTLATLRPFTLRLARNVALFTGTATPKLSPRRRIRFSRLDDRMRILRESLSAGMPVDPVPPGGPPPGAGVAGGGLCGAEGLGSV